MQGALDVVDVRKSDVRAPSTWTYEYTLYLYKAPQDGADVGLEGVWRRAARGQMRVRGRVVGVGVGRTTAGRVSGFCAVVCWSSSSTGRVVLYRYL
jgi:hypothetical protein